MLARAFLRDASFYFIDEPTAGMDFQMKVNVVKVLKEKLRENGNYCDSRSFRKGSTRMQGNSNRWMWLISTGSYISGYCLIKLMNG